MALYFILGVIAGIVFTVASIIAVLYLVAQALEAEHDNYFEPKF